MAGKYGFTPTYSVNPDYAGVMNGTNGGDNFAFVILDDGWEILGTDIETDTSAGTTINIVIKKQDQDHRRG